MPFSPARPNGVRTPSTKTTSRSMPLRLRENSGVEVWTEHLRREEERYRDGESRLPDAADADARQRQLTRLGNAAAGAGLALVMAGRRDAAWTLEQGADDAQTPIGRYAAALAHAIRRDWAALRVHADALLTDDGFPHDVADALAFVASPDPVGYVEAIESVLESFESRDAYLEDLPAADTVVVLQALAERRGIAPAALESPMLPR